MGDIIDFNTRKKMYIQNDNIMYDEITFWNLEQYYKNIMNNIDCLAVNVNRSLILLKLKKIEKMNNISKNKFIELAKQINFISLDEYDMIVNISRLISIFLTLNERINMMDLDDLTDILIIMKKYKLKTNKNETGIAIKKFIYERR